MEEEWGFLLIDARNAFNEINHTVMLPVIRHEWPSQLLPKSGYSWRNRKDSQNFKPKRSNARRSSFHDLLWDRNRPSYSQAQE